MSNKIIEFRTWHIPAAFILFFLLGWWIGSLIIHLWGL